VPLFSPEEVKKKIQETLNQDVSIPDNHKAALVTFINSDKAEAAFAIKVQDNWHIELIASHSWTGENEVGVLNKITW
jgi:hypothetical protein